ncbi:MAG: hypothetical protein ACLFPO_13325 [Spirochaetaceae bacterium]
MADTRKQWGLKRLLTVGLLVSAAAILTVSCNNPTSGNNGGGGGDDDNDTDRTLTLSGEIEGWPGGTGVVTVPNVGDDTGDEGAVDDSGAFSIVVSDLEKAGVSLNTAQAFETAFNDMDWDTNPVVEGNTFVEQFHTDLVGEPQFADGDIVFTVTGAEKDDGLLRGFDVLDVDGSDLVRSGVDDNEVDTRWLYSAANVEIQAEAVLTLEEDGGSNREVDLVFVWDTAFTRGWNSYSFFSPAGMDALELNDLLNEEELRFGYSTAVEEPTNVAWSID